MTMVEQQYLASGLAHSNDLSGAIPTTTTASAYPELSTYTTVSSSPFTYPSQCDSNLLTPSSTSGSPPQHQARQLVHHYSATTPAPQQPTPPGSTKMYPQQWTTSFDMTSQSTQPETSMTTQAPVSSDYMESSYLNDGRRTPGPPEPYMGAFGVSDGPEPTATMNPPYYMMPPPLDQQQPQHLPMPSSMTLLNSHHPSQFRPRHLTPEEHPLPGMLDRSGNGSPRRRAASTTSAGRITKKRNGKNRGSQRVPIMGDPLEEHKNCFGQEVPPRLKPNCPEEERCIFESRWQHRHQKGQDMWESIQNDFKNKFHKCPGKEMLQMKFKRGRSKYIDWLSRDEELLLEAWKQVEKNRYQHILETFMELGGSRNMRLNASDIECKLVNDMKLEEALYIETQDDLHIRRRVRKSNGSSRRRTNARGGDEPLSDELMSVGSHTNEDDVINQVHGRSDYRLEDDSSADGSNNMMDMQMWGDQQVKMEQGVMPSRSETMPQMIRLSPAAGSYGRHR